MVIELNRKNEHNIPEEQLNALAMSFYYAMLEYFQTEKGRLSMRNSLQCRTKSRLHNYFFGIIYMNFIFRCVGV